MHLTKEERNTVVSFFTLFVSVFLFASVFMIPQKGSFLQSARLMPLITTIIMLMLSSVFFISSIRKASPTFSKVVGSFKSVVTSKEWQNIFLSILIVAIYVFIGIPYIGFYISSIALLLFIMLYYVRRLKPIISIISSVAVTGLLYLIFTVAFKIPLR